MITVIIPIRTVSLANQREHWAERASRARYQRSCAAWLVRSGLLGQPPTDTSGRLAIELTRLAPRKLDSDNLAGACKSIRDGVADALGIDDGSELVTWTYGQEKAKNYAVRVTVKGWAG